MSPFRQQVGPFAPLRLPVRGRTPTGLSGSQSPQASPGFLIHDSTIMEQVTTAVSLCSPAPSFVC